VLFCEARRKLSLSFFFEKIKKPNEALFTKKSPGTIYRCKCD
jgi:hypothetical protein